MSYSSLLKGLLNETRKINEEDLFSDEEVGPAVGGEMAPEEVMADEPVADEGIEITDELVAELAEANPAIAEVDAAEFKAGLEKEIKYLECLGGDLNTVACLVLAHINEFAGKDYYGALATMEASLMEPAEDMPVEGEEVAMEEPAFEDEEVVEEATDAVGANPTSDKAQPSAKALAQTKNESAVGTDVGKVTATHKDEKGDEKDIKKQGMMSKEEEMKLKAEQKADDKHKDANEGVGADKQAKGSVKSAMKDEKKDGEKTKMQAAAHKAADKKDKNTAEKK